MYHLMISKVQLWFIMLRKMMIAVVSFLIQRIVILTMILMPLQGSCLTMDNAIPAIPTRYW